MRPAGLDDDAVDAAEQPVRGRASRIEICRRRRRRRTEARPGRSTGGGSRAKAKQELKVVKKLAGKELLGKRYRPPFDYYYQATGEKTGTLKSGGKQHASNRRKLIVGGGILAVIVAAGVLIPLLALSGGKSSSPETAAASRRAHHGRHADRRARGGESAVSRGAVAGHEGVHSAKRAGQRGSGDLRLRVGADRSDIRAQRVPILVLSRAQALLRAYGQEFSRARGAGNTLVKWIRSGGRTCLDPPDREAGRSVFCHQDAKGNFVIVWTHEKLGSTDHVDMLGTATEPGRAPTIVGGWWNSLNDSIGKCRPKVSEELCLATIARITGTP